MRPAGHPALTVLRVLTVLTLVFVFSWWNQMDNRLQAATANERRSDRLRRPVGTRTLQLSSTLLYLTRSRANSVQLQRDT
jgi:hypothetical protein